MGILLSIMLYSVSQAPLEAYEKPCMPAIAKQPLLRGPRGHRGSRGQHGHRGKNGKNGVNGIDGATGPTGATGASGPPGPTGAAGTGSVSAINGDVQGPSSVIDEIVQFNATPVALNGVDYNGSSAFTILTAGDYRVSYALTGDITLTGVLVSGLAVDFQILINGIPDTDSQIQVVRSSADLPEVFTVLVMFERIYSLNVDDTVRIRAAGTVITGDGTFAATDGNFLVMKLD